LSVSIFLFSIHLFSFIHFHWGHGAWFGPAWFWFWFGLAGVISQLLFFRMILGKSLFAIIFRKRIGVLGRFGWGRKEYVPLEDGA